MAADDKLALCVMDKKRDGGCGGERRKGCQDGKIARKDEEKGRCKWSRCVWEATTDTKSPDGDLFAEGALGYGPRIARKH